jgi:hypothetical protein
MNQAYEFFDVGRMKTRSLKGMVVTQLPCHHSSDDHALCGLELSMGLEKFGDRAGMHQVDWLNLIIVY